MPLEAEFQVKGGKKEEKTIHRALVTPNLHYRLLYPVEPEPEGLWVTEMTFIMITSFHTLLKAVRAYTS